MHCAQAVVCYCTGRGIAQNSVVHNSQARTPKELRAALERIEAGVYGICQQCCRPINRERLEILPATPLCVACSAAVEESGVQPDIVLAV